ncbi:MAG TPA: amidohydrolase [Candidatus Sulfotelmatobacter sp.]|nr:amidohydrolase [Candidatus Sulfotelmatobacter sp.]
MRTARFILASGILALNALHPVAFAQSASTDLILFNGNVFTSNASQPYVEALAIRGDRIVAVGTSKEVVALASKGTRRIDLGGRTVIPGINDSHLHLEVKPSHYDLPLKSDDPTWQEMIDALTAAVPKVAKGTWIEGVFGPTIIDDPHATKGSLDALSPDNLVVLWDWTGHASLLNTAAMQKFGIREDEPDPQGGRFERNHANGKLTGMAFEYAMERVIVPYVGLVSDDEAVSQLRSFFDGAAQLGITTLQDMASPISAERCAVLLERASPPIRVRVMWMGSTDEHGRAISEGRASNLHPTPLVTVSGTKWVLDGTPIERSAATRQPYADRPSTSGELLFPEKEMENMLRESLQRNDQLMVHVVGDHTIETFLNAMDATGGEKVWSKRRVRLEHGDGLMPDLVPRAKRLGVIVVQNPTHFALGELFVKRFGDKRSQMLFPVRSLLEAGIPVALGSDGSLNPFLNIMLASSHPGNPKEAMTREQAVIAYTLTSAYAEFAENDKGSLEPGKLADLAVLSQDIIKVPAEDLPKTESVLTVVGGKVVYDAKVLTMN